MRLIHGWKKEKARAATNLLGLRKQYTTKAANKPSKDRHKDYHVPKPCPVAGCMSVVKRMSPHLTQHHHVQPKSNTLQMYLLQARRMYRESKLHCEGEDFESDDSDVEKLTYDASDVEPLNSTEDHVPLQINNNSNLNEIPAATLTDFHKWLQSVDGGKKKSADQHKSQIGVIVEQLGDTSQLLNKNLIKAKFLDTYVFEKKVSSRHYQVIFVKFETLVRLYPDQQLSVD
jgi:hypothetical protein